MSFHVRKCVVNDQGRQEHVIYYPGLTEEQAQEVASAINAGLLDLIKDPSKTPQRLVKEVSEKLAKDYIDNKLESMNDLVTSSMNTAKALFTARDSFDTSRMYREMGRAGVAIELLCAALIKENDKTTSTTTASYPQMVEQLSTLKTDEVLLNKLKQAANHQLTPEERFEQRVSWAFSVIKDATKGLSREQVRQILSDL